MLKLQEDWSNWGRGGVINQHGDRTFLSVLYWKEFRLNKLSSLTFQQSITKSLQDNNLWKHENSFVLRCPIIENSVKNGVECVLYFLPCAIFACSKFFPFLKGVNCFIFEFMSFSKTLTLCSLYLIVIPFCNLRQLLSCRNRRTRGHFYAT